jgi:hypothetical protein
VVVQRTENKEHRTNMCLFGIHNVAGVVNDSVLELGVVFEGGRNVGVVVVRVAGGAGRTGDGLGATGRGWAALVSPERFERAAGGSVFDDGSRASSV